MDWIEYLKKEYGDVRELKNLQARKYFGKITLTFQNGKIGSINFSEVILQKSARDRADRKKSEENNYYKSGVGATKPD